MALQGDRRVLETDISLICNDVCEQGEVLCYGTAASGAALDGGTCTLAANPSGMTPAGLTLADFVNIDTTRYHRNWQAMVQLVGEHAPLLTKGWVTTNKVTGTPNVGNTAYLTANGVVTPTVSATGGIAATPKVGMFNSKIDEDGYCKLTVLLPQI